MYVVYVWYYVVGAVYVYTGSSTGACTIAMDSYVNKRVYVNIVTQSMAMHCRDHRSK